MLGEEALMEAFRSHFNSSPGMCSRAPGRVNLIGDHTDYNEGFVFPVAINRAVTILSSPRSDRIVRLYSVNFDEYLEFGLTELQPGEKAHWSSYVKGVAREFLALGCEIGGFDGVITGDVPTGSGLASSAALEVAVAFMISGLSGFNIPRRDIALLCQRAEQNFVGVKCGIMDQFISALGVEDHGLFIDCRSLDYSIVPLNLDGYSLVICDSNAPRELASSAYNERWRECMEGVRLLSAHLPGISALRDVSSRDLSKLAELLPEPIRSRCRHVISEDERALEAVKNLENGRLVEFGRLMIASHDSLKRDYEVSSPSLDRLVELALAGSECLGSRMTGAGFGGCTVSLVKDTGIEQFIDRVSRGYRESTGRAVTPIMSRAMNGAEVSPCR